MNGNDLMFLGRCSVAVIAAAAILSADAVQPIRPQFIEQVASYRDDDGSHCAVLRAVAGWSSILSVRMRDDAREPRFLSSNEAGARGASRQPLLRDAASGGWVAQPNRVTWHPVPSPDTRLYETFIHACADGDSPVAMRDVSGVGGESIMDIDFPGGAISASQHAIGMVAPEGWRRTRTRYGEKRTLALRLDDRALACERWTAAGNQGPHRVEVVPSKVALPLRWIEVVESERDGPAVLASWRPSAGADNAEATATLPFTLTQAGRVDVLVCFAADAGPMEFVLYALRVE